MAETIPEENESMLLRMEQTAQKVDDDVSSTTSFRPPLHPVPQLQGPFDESMLESLIEPSANQGDKNGAASRRAQLLESDQYERTIAGRWKQRPGEKYHPLWKLTAQLTFGLHLLSQNLAKSDEDVMRILQSHVNDIDCFLERSTEDLELAQTDIQERLRWLKLPLEHTDTFERMLQDRSFRSSIIEGNEKIEHVIDRTSEAMKDSLKDIQKGIDATNSLKKYLATLKPEWQNQSPESSAVYQAMIGNVEGWQHALLGLQWKGKRLGVVLVQLAGVVVEMAKRVATASKASLEASPQSSRPPSGPVSPRSSKDNSKGARSATSEEKPLPTEPETPNPIRQVTIVKRHRSQDLQEQVLSPKETEDFVRKLSRSKLSKGKSNLSIKRRGSSKSRSIRGTYYDRQKHNASKSPTGQRLESARDGSGMSDGSIGAMVQDNDATGQMPNHKRQISAPPTSSKSPESRKLSFTERTRSLTKRISSSDFSKSRSVSNVNARENRPVGPLKENDDSRAAGNVPQSEVKDTTGQSKGSRSRTRTLTDKTRSLGRRISRGDLLARKRTAAKNQSNTIVPQLPQGKSDFDKTQSTLNAIVPPTQNPRKRSVTADDQYERLADSTFQGDKSNGTITLYELSGDTTFSKDLTQHSAKPKVRGENQTHVEKNVTRQEGQGGAAFATLRPSIAPRPNDEATQNDHSGPASTKHRPSQDRMIPPPPADQFPALNPRKLRKKSLDENAFRPHSAKSQKSFPSQADGRRPSLTRKVQKALFGDRSSEPGRAMSMPSSLRPIGEKPPRIPTPEPSAFLTQGLDEVIEKWKKDDSLAGRESPNQSNLQLPSSTDVEGQRPHSARSASYSLFPIDTNRSTTPRPSRPTSSVDVNQEPENETQNTDSDRPLLPGRNPTFTSHPPNMALGTPPSISRVTELSRMPIMQASPARTPLPQDSEQHKSMVLEIDTATLATRNSTYTTSTPGADTDVPSLPPSLPTSAHPGTDGLEKSKSQYTEVSRPTSSAFDKAELPLGTRDIAEPPPDRMEAPLPPSPEDSQENGPTTSIEPSSNSKESLPHPVDPNLELKQRGPQIPQVPEKVAKSDPSPTEKPAREEKPSINTSSNKAGNPTSKEAASPRSGPSHLAEVVLARARPRFPDRSYQRRSFPSIGSWADPNFGRLNPVEEESDHHEPLDRSQSASQVNIARSDRIKNVGATLRRRPLSASFTLGPQFNASKERVDELMLPKLRPQSMYNTSNLEMDGAASQADPRPASSVSTVKPARDSSVLKHLSQVTVLGPISAPSNESESEASHPVEEALQRLLDAHEDETRNSPRRPLSNSSAADALRTLSGDFDSTTSGVETADEAYKRLTIDRSSTSTLKPSVPEKDRTSTSTGTDPPQASKGDRDRDLPNISRRRSPVKQLLVHAMSGALPPLSTSTTTIPSSSSTQDTSQTPISAYQSRPVSAAALSAYPSPTNNARTHHLSSPIVIPASFAAPTPSPYVSIGTQTSPATANKHSNSNSNRHSWAGTPTPTTATPATTTPTAAAPPPGDRGSFFALPRRRSRTLGSTSPNPNPTANSSARSSLSLSLRRPSFTSPSKSQTRRLSTAEAEAEAGIFRVQFPTISSELVNSISVSRGNSLASSSASSLRGKGKGKGKGKGNDARPGLRPSEPEPSSKHVRNPSSTSASTEKDKEKEKAKRKSKTRHIGEAAHERERERERRSIEESQSRTKSMRKEAERDRARALVGVNANTSANSGAGEQRKAGSKKTKTLGMGRLWRRVLPAVNAVQGLKKSENKGKALGREEGAEPGKERKSGERPRSKAGGGGKGGEVLMGGGGGDVRVFRGVGRDGRWVGG
ncbi:MAG: hypothetical protein Q9160_002905 [Pyrenula sp. 1 TL-2023]